MTNPQVKPLLGSFLLLNGFLCIHAATLTVTTINDSGAGSLRQHIQTALSGDSINFAVTGTITLTTGELLVTNNLTITGPGATNLAVSGNNQYRVFEISPGSAVIISALGIRNGHATNGPSGASGSNGGGIYNSGTLTLRDCIVSQNSSGTGGASGGHGGLGGGIYNVGALILTSCALSSNSGGSGGFGPFPLDFCCGAGGRGGSGGAIYNAGTLFLTNCTLAGNSAGSGGHGGGGYVTGNPGGPGGDGGGIFNSNILILTACTLNSNAAGPGGDGGFGYNPGSPGHGSGSAGGNGGSGGNIFSTSNAPPANLRNVLVVDGSAGIGALGGSGPDGNGSPGSYGTGPDLAGTFNSQGHNLASRTDGSAGITDGLNDDLAGTAVNPLDPLLGLLESNGGPTPTMAVLAGSPALNTGDDALLALPFSLRTDQRGLPRKSGAHVDIGAFERQSLLLTGAAPAGTNVMVSFIAEIGSTYRVERKDDLSSANWTTVADNLPGTGSMLQVFDPGAANQPQRFYRARTVP